MENHKVLVHATTILVTVLATGVSLADDLAELVKKWGVVGRWSTDCSPEALPHGVVAYDIEPDGQVIIDNGQRVTEMRITGFTADGDLILNRAAVNGQELRVLLLRRSGDTLRPSITGNERNDHTARDGKFVASLRETLPVRQCKN